MKNLFILALFLLTTTVLYGQEKRSLAIISIDTKGLSVDNATMANIVVPSDIALLEAEQSVTTSTHWLLIG